MYRCIESLGNFEKIKRSEAEENYINQIALDIISSECDAKLKTGNEEFVTLEKKVIETRFLMEAPEDVSVLNHTIANLVASGVISSDGNISDDDTSIILNIAAFQELYEKSSIRKATDEIEIQQAPVYQKRG